MYTCPAAQATSAAASEISSVPSSWGTWSSSATPRRRRRRRRSCRPPTTATRPASPPRSKAWPPAPWARWRRPASPQCTPCSPPQTSSCFLFSAFRRNYDSAWTLKNVSAHVEWAEQKLDYIRVLRCRAFMSTCLSGQRFRRQLGKQVAERTTGSVKQGARAGTESMVWFLMRPSDLEDMHWFVVSTASSSYLVWNCQLLCLHHLYSLLFCTSSVSEIRERLCQFIPVLVGSFESVCNCNAAQATTQQVSVETMWILWISYNIFTFLYGTLDLERKAVLWFFG